MFLLGTDNYQAHGSRRAALVEKDVACPTKSLDLMGTWRQAYGTVVQNPIKTV